MLGKAWIRRGPKRWIKESKYLRYVQGLWPDFRVWGRECGDLPSFLIIGAQRSGTTFLHDRLSVNTSAECSPLQKEVHYFDNKYYKRIEWYSKFFSPKQRRKDYRKTFETSPYYIYHPAVPERVSESLSTPSILVVLRDPVDRAISHYKWMRQVGLEQRGAVQAFQYDAKRRKLEEDSSYLEKFNDPFYFDYDHIFRSYLRRSLYSIQLQRWLRWFEPSQIRIITSSKLFERPHSVIKELVEFLNLDYAEREAKAAVNRNSSRQGIRVSDEARSIAERFLAGEEKKVRELISNKMVVGDNLVLQ